MKAIDKINHNQMQLLVEQTLQRGQTMITSNELPQNEPKQLEIQLINDNGDVITYEAFKSFKGTFSHSDEFIRFMKFAFWHCLKKVAPHFEPTEQQKKFINLIFLYAIKSDQSVLDTNRGLYIYGTIGFGKSDVITALNEFNRFWWGKLAFIFQSATSCVNEYQHDQDLNYLTSRMQSGVSKPFVFCWDDLGLEPLRVKSFGNDINLFSSLINIRYELWKQTGLKTYFTTNLAKDGFIDENTGKYKDGFIDRYTQTNYSRIIQMCNVISVSSEDQREQFKKVVKIE